MARIEVRIWASTSEPIRRMPSLTRRSSRSRPARDRVASARRTFELVSRRRAEGAASQIDFLDARTAYTRAELNLILTRQSYAVRAAELERAAALRDPM